MLFKNRKIEKKNKIEITSYFILLDKGISKVGKGEALPEYEPLVCEDEFALCNLEKQIFCSSFPCI
eukprot:snap_masked-scaffold_8-processed-gene-14.69-mRNA-1 protein AED:1.00 eAED:1.00 QI:0/0/0/0/1/1/2/0/65